MTPFTDLMRSPAPPVDSIGEWQRAVDDRFPAVVSASPFRLWHPGDPIAPGRRLLLGVATWSGYDMTLLDELGLRLPPDLVIDVFNTADVRSHREFERYVPGIGNVFHTPVVGLWIDGRLVAKASGKAGRDLVAQACSAVLA